MERGEGHSHWARPGRMPEKPKKTIRTVRTKRGVREYYWVGCPLTKNRTAWCFRLCDPDAEGKGQCGRIAPHGLKSRTQRAIDARNRELQKARIDALEADYLAAAGAGGHEPGVRVTVGEAEVAFHRDDGVGSDARPVSPTLCFDAMYQSSRLAVASLLESGDASAAEFSVTLTGIAAGADLIARSLFVGQSDDRYLTESILTDEDARDLGRATGVFAAGS